MKIGREGLAVPGPINLRIMPEGGKVDIATVRATAVNPAILHKHKSVYMIACRTSHIISPRNVGS